MHDQIQLLLKTLLPESCYLLCIIWCCYKQTGRCATLSDLEAIVSKGYVRYDGFVISPIDVFLYLGVSVTMVEKGGDFVIAATPNNAHFFVSESPWGSFEPSVKKVRDIASYRRFKLQSVS